MITLLLVSSSFCDHSSLITFEAIDVAWIRELMQDQSPDFHQAVDDSLHPCVSPDKRATDSVPEGRPG